LNVKVAANIGFATNFLPALKGSRVPSRRAHHSSHRFGTTFLIWWTAGWLRDLHSHLKMRLSSKLRLVLEGKEITVTPPTVPLNWGEAPLASLREILEK
jgi:hypothetical protein